MFEFVWPWLLLLLPLPLVTRWLAEKPVQPQSALRVTRIISPSQKTSQPQTTHQRKLLALWLIWSLLILSVARPQWLGEPISIPNEGRDLMVAVDLSGSMQIEDMQVNNRAVDRLVMIKYVLKDFIKRRVGDRIGLILFADTAYQQTPLTYDRTTVEQLLMESVIGLVGDKTAIGDAIGLAVKRFEEKQQSSKVLILLTDGRNTAGNLTPEEALSLAKSEGITIYTIGVGADKMVQRSLFGRREFNPSKDLDENMLRSLAEQTGGLYFRAKNAEQLQQIYHKLDELEPIVRDEQQMRPLRSLFHYPLSIAFCLTLLMCAPMLRRSRT